MFTVEGRTRLRSSLLEYGSSDPRITGAAITGSAAEQKEDEWSDIDLAFGVATGASLEDVLKDWTAHMYGRHEAVHHLDVHAGPWIYRVFLLRDTMQVDLAFVPAGEFRALAPSFRLVAGQAGEPRHMPPPAACDLIGFGWLYAVHARSAIARRSPWKAEYMISGVRDHALALACLRHGLPAVRGRGLDLLPADIKVRFEDSLVRDLTGAGLERAFRAALDALASEITHADAVLASRLQGTLRSLAGSH